MIGLKDIPAEELEAEFERLQSTETLNPILNTFRPSGKSGRLLPLNFTRCVASKRLTRYVKGVVPQARVREEPTVQLTFTIGLRNPGPGTPRIVF